MFSSPPPFPAWLSLANSSPSPQLQGSSQTRCQAKGELRALRSGNEDAKGVKKSIPTHPAWNGWLECPPTSSPPDSHWLQREIGRRCQFPPPELQGDGVGGGGANSFLWIGGCAHFLLCSGESQEEARLPRWTLQWPSASGRSSDAGKGGSCGHLMISRWDTPQDRFCLFGFSACK